MCPGCMKEGSREGQGLERPLHPWKGFECSKSLGSGLLALGKPGQPVLGVVHTSLLPLEVQGLLHVLPSKKLRNWARLAWLW